MVDEAFTSVARGQSHLRPGPIAARIGEHVRSWRQGAGISDADLASTLNMPIDALRSAEAGESCFTAEQIVTICQVFNLPPSRFLDNLL